MNRNIRRAFALAATLLLAGSMTLGFAADKQQTLTGTVSDSMCGAKHQMADSAACTRACIGHGAKYALVVGSKVYTLEGGDQAELDKLAGAKATVKGTVNGDTVTVASVAPAKG
jgi:hypothetical protein